MAKKQKPPILTATEIADYVYCPKAWKLKRDGEVAESTQLEPGVEFHASHGDQISLAGRARSFAFVAIVLAALLLLAALMFR